MGTDISVGAANWLAPVVGIQSHFSAARASVAELGHGPYAKRLKTSVSSLGQLALERRRADLQRVEAARTRIAARESGLSREELARIEDPIIVAYSGGGARTAAALKPERQANGKRRWS